MASGGSTTRVAIDANTVLSGLFFTGNERRLLLRSLEGKVVLVFAEDIVEEVYAAIQDTFESHPDLPGALEFLKTVFGVGELLARREYREKVELWSRRVRDQTDAPLAAAAVAAKVDCLVTGDRDLLVLEEVESIPIVRTKQLLDLLDRQREV